MIPAPGLSVAESHLTLAVPGSQSTDSTVSGHNHVLGKTPYSSKKKKNTATFPYISCCFLFVVVVWGFFCWFVWGFFFCRCFCLFVFAQAKALLHLVDVSVQSGHCRRFERRVCRFRI